MRFTSAVVAFILLAAMGRSQPKRGNSQEFARMAVEAPATAKKTTPVGELSDGRSRLHVTALIIQPPSAAPSPWRGIQVDFFDGHSRWVAYIVEEVVREEKRIAERIAQDSRAVMRPAGGLAYVGSCEFRDHPGAFPIELDALVAGAGSPALRLSTAEHTLLINNQSPADLAALFGKALEALDASK